MKKKSWKQNYNDLLKEINGLFDKFKIKDEDYKAYYKEKKAKYWAFIVYPESANPKWKDLLIQYGIKFAVSPLHDKDRKSDHLVGVHNVLLEAETKKSHYHVLLAFPNTTTFNYVNSIAKEAQGVFPVPVSSVRSYYRYLWHADETDPDKYHYKEKDVTTYNGFSIRDFIGESSSERDEILQFIENFIAQYDVKSYFSLIQSLKYYNFEIEARVARSSYGYFKNYLESMHKNYRETQNEVDIRALRERLEALEGK